MVKQALKSAIGIGVGTTIGGCVLPRLFFGDLYNGTWPPIWAQALMYFAVGYTVAFLIFLLINWLKCRKDKLS